MPIYEYECLRCGKHFEIIQKFDDEPLSICSDCGGHMHKLISHTSFILKGSGWYVTDYARPEKKRSEGFEKKPAARTETKTETKPKTETVTKN
jgi:putative FmdB family regulatory protein